MVGIDEVKGDLRLTYLSDLFVFLYCTESYKSV